MGAMGGGTETRAPPWKNFGGAPPPKKIYKKEKIYKKWSKKSIKKEKRKKSIKSGLKTRLERFKNQKFSYPGEGDTPHPPRASLVPPPGKFPVAPLYSHIQFHRIYI